jgi:hypothetical protein
VTWRQAKRVLSTGDPALKGVRFVTDMEGRLEPAFAGLVTVTFGLLLGPVDFQQEL